jgi:hypothetical protein
MVQTTTEPPGPDASKINKACRGRDREEGPQYDDDGSSSGGDPLVPMGLWPIVFARLTRGSPMARLNFGRTDTRRAANGMYYLLRRGPVLLERYETPLRVGFPSNAPSSPLLLLSSTTSDHHSDHPMLVNDSDGGPVASMPFSPDDSPISHLDGWTGTRTANKHQHCRNQSPHDFTTSSTVTQRKRVRVAQDGPPMQG